MKNRVHAASVLARGSVVWELLDPRRMEAVVSASPRWPRTWSGRRGLERRVAETCLAPGQREPFARWYAGQLRALGWSVQAPASRK